MPPRSSWKGYLRLSLVSVPVKAFTATSSSSQIHLNQLHCDCHSRIQYKKVCPLHGEVSNDQIQSGYEYAKGQYAVVDTDDLEVLRTESDRSIAVDKFFQAESLDSLYETDTTYYLVPDGPIGQKPYALLRRVMAEAGLHGVGQVVISKKERLVRIRPIGDMLAMTVLHYAPEIKLPTSFSDELSPQETNEQELKLARQLLEGLRDDDFDITKYRDAYTEKLTQLIQAKVDGEELVAPPPVEEPQVINLMEALKASVERVAPPTAARAPRQKVASKTTRTRKKKAAKTASTTRKKKRTG